MLMLLEDGLRESDGLERCPDDLVREKVRPAGSALGLGRVSGVLVDSRAVGLV
jgi:hypothetical protein